MTLGELVKKLGPDTPILGELPMTADGALIGVDAEIFFTKGPESNRVVFNLWRKDVTSPHPLVAIVAFSTREAALAAMKEKA